MSEELKNKMLNMEVAPPAAAWDFIEAALDKQSSGEWNLQQKMLQLEVPPPDAVWTSLEKVLDTKTDSFRQHHYPRISWQRYAVAAAIIGITGLLVFRFFIPGESGKQSTPPAAVISNAAPTTSVEDKKNINQDNLTLINESENSRLASTANSNPTPEKKTVSENSIQADNNIALKKVTADIPENEQLYNPAEGVRVVARDISSDLPTGVNALTANPNYFITTNPSGEVIRVSNKLAGVMELFGEAATQDYYTRLLEEAAAWKQRYENLRLKLSKVSPAPDNFMDIVQLAAALKDDKHP